MRVRTAWKWVPKRQHSVRLLLRPTTKTDAKDISPAPMIQSKVSRLKFWILVSTCVVYAAVEYNVPSTMAAICGEATIQFRPASLQRRRVTAIVGSRVNIPNSNEIGPSLLDDRPNSAVSITEIGSQATIVNAVHHQYSALDEYPLNCPYFEKHVLTALGKDIPSLVFSCLSRLFTDFPMPSSPCEGLRRTGSRQCPQG